MFVCLVYWGKKRNIKMSDKIILNKFNSVMYIQIFWNEAINNAVLNLKNIAAYPSIIFIKKKCLFEISTHNKLSFKTVTCTNLSLVLVECYVGRKKSIIKYAIKRHQRIKNKRSIWLKEQLRILLPRKRQIGIISQMSRFQRSCDVVTKRETRERRPVHKGHRGASWESQP